MRFLPLIVALLLFFDIPRPSVAGPGDGAWTLLATLGPGSRFGATMIYDPPRDRLIVFGGQGAFGDPWEFPLATNGPWQMLPATGSPPATRAFHTAIYDRIGDRMVIYGGFTNTGALADVWALNLGGGQSPMWQQLSPGGTQPASRYWHSAVYNDRFERMTIFGGVNKNDTWELTLSPGNEAWTAPVQPVGTPPPARCCHESIFVPTWGRMLMFGGWNGTELADLWELPFAVFPSPGWTLLTTNGAISGRTDHAAAFDRMRNRMIVDGGVRGSIHLAATWALPLEGPLAWSVLAPTGPAPGGRSDHSVVYDPVRDRLLVYGPMQGGEPGDIWALTWGASTAIHATCPDEIGIAPGDTVRVTFGIVNPFAAATDYEFTVTSARAWPLASGNGRISVYQPFGQLPWSFVVPDTAAPGTVDLAFHVRVVDAPVLADSCTLQLIDHTTSTRLSLTTTSATPGEVRLEWYTAAREETHALERLAPGGEWQWIANLRSDGSGRLLYTDRDVQPGSRYGYRLTGQSSQEGEVETWVDVPAHPSFALHRAWYGGNALWVDVSLSGDGPARIELFNPAGRLLLSRALDGGADARQQRSIPCALSPGVQFVRVVQGANEAHSRILVAR